MLRERLEGQLWTQTANGRVLHVFEPVILALALLSVPVILIEQSGAGQTWDTVALVANWVIWAGFTAEVVFILAVAPRRLAALRAHWLDVAIVVLTAPFLTTVLAALRLLRLARFARLLRVGRLALYGARALTATRVLTTRQGFRYVALATVMLVVVAGFSIAQADAEKFPNVWLGMWWAITTVTTVGYGDVVPTSVSGRVLAGVLMVIGIGFLSILTAAVASWFVRSDTAETEKRIEDEQASIVEALRGIDQRLGRLEERSVASGEVRDALERIEARLPGQ